MKKNEYHIVSGELGLISKHVGEYLDEGWVCVGGVSRETWSDVGVVYCQAIRRLVDVEEEK